MGGLVETQFPHHSCQITVLGSKSHYHPQSCDLVAARIRKLRPSAVMVEISRCMMQDPRAWVTGYQFVRSHGFWSGRRDMVEAMAAVVHLSRVESSGECQRLIFAVFACEGLRRQRRSDFGRPPQSVRSPTTGHCHVLIDCFLGVQSCDGPQHQALFSG
jgi:hypothetical protein